MIPTFPKFKKISIRDRSALYPYLPRKAYSDYNFTNLWCWDTHGKRRISILNGNLVVLFTDYLTNRPYLSFFGRRKPVTTAKTLLTYAREHNIPPKLKYIPDSTARLLQNSSLNLAEDAENFDYIFSTTQIAKAPGSSMKRRRQYANQFSRLYPDARFEVISFTRRNIHRQLLLTFKKWCRNKKHTAISTYMYEDRALKRLIAPGQKHDVVASCIFIGGTMIAFSIDEILNNKQAISHFLKADTQYKGVYEFLNMKTAQFLKEQGVEYWNWEQDLNIEGLRKLKMSYRPVHFLKKYTIEI